ncbi:BgTH12-05704 [Blumeria graminis f. sp. triticale]|uniref:BgTH12-05704 n=1 Tax=Blumeria graminis f. sp. triticale TaxID=1689686 RepID=A0A9W4GFV1_BLUGR|nr:BgTH12-05704 [Blumeria graminis f. sp. triticale]
MINHRDRIQINHRKGCRKPDFRNQRKTTMSSVLRRRFSALSDPSYLKRASKVVCVGRNYADHIAELNSTRPKYPLFFLKPPSTILLPGEGPVLRPRGVTLHHEVELALVMGKRVKDLDQNDTQGALDAIGGYALCIDMTARNVQSAAIAKGLPWTTCKGFDTFLPTSSFIPKSAIPDPHNVELFLRINNEPQPRQCDSTRLFLFQIPQVLAAISSVFTLEKGDIIITGTPKGVGPVVPGDTMYAGININGAELDCAKIKVRVEESTSTYEYCES